MTQAAPPPGITEDRIEALVRGFYAAARADALLGPIFEHAIGTDDAAWQAHFVRLDAFWSSILRRSGRYHGDPYSVHLKLDGLTPEHFARWLSLFGTACRAIFEAEDAAYVEARAANIARSLQLGLFAKPHLPAA